MSRTILTLLLGAACLTNVAAQEHITAAERAQLPKYCYAQFVDEKLRGHPEYSINGCGVSMNHFCYGLIYLIRAQKATDRAAYRRANAAHAITDIKYTLRGMTDDCRLRADAEAALNRATSILKLAK